MKIFIEKVISEPNKRAMGCAIVMVETKHFKNHLSVLIDKPIPIKENTWIEGRLCPHPLSIGFRSKKYFDLDIRYGIERHNKEEIALVGYDYNGNGDFEYEGACYIRGIVKELDIPDIKDDYSYITISSKEMEFEWVEIERKKRPMNIGDIISGEFVVDLIIENEIDKDYLI